jgi:hypothetical protein
MKIIYKITIDSKTTFGYKIIKESFEAMVLALQTFHHQFKSRKIKLEVVKEIE